MDSEHPHYAYEETFLAIKYLGKRPRPNAPSVEMETMLAVEPLMWGMALLTIGPGGPDYDAGSDDGWEYQDRGRAIRPLSGWRVQPSGSPLPSHSTSARIARPLS